VQIADKVLGPPSRIDTGATPAPVGFRNNHIYVFDEIGIHVIQHHYTRRACALDITLDVTEDRFRFTPKSPFTGDLLFDQSKMPLRASEAPFLNASPSAFKHFIAGHFSATFDGFLIGLFFTGRRLASGRRSKHRQIVSVSISWPHDPWGEPLPDGS
jgi:hypothetical protein